MSESFEKLPEEIKHNLIQNNGFKEEWSFSHSTYFTAYRYVRERNLDPAKIIAVKGLIDTVSSFFMAGYLPEGWNLEFLYATPASPTRIRVELHFSYA